MLKGSEEQSQTNVSGLKCASFFLHLPLSSCSFHPHTCSTWHKDCSAREEKWSNSFPLLHGHFHCVQGDILIEICEVQSSPTSAFKRDATSEITFLDLAYSCKVRRTSKHSLNGPTRRTFAKLGATGFPCWHFLSDRRPTSVSASPRCPFSVHCGRLTEEAGVGRTWTASQIFVLFHWKQMFSVCSHHHSGFPAVRSLGRSAVRYQVETHWQVFMLECLHSVKLQGFFPGFASTFMC